MKAVVCLFLVSAWFFPGIAKSWGAFVVDRPWGDTVFYSRFESGVIAPWQEAVPGRWEVSAERSLSGKGSLHHAFDNSSAGSDQVFLETQYADKDVDMEIAFVVRHGYPPSGSNNWQLFIQATKARSEENGIFVPGYVFGVNYHCSDDTVRLWEITEGEVGVICSMGAVYEALSDETGVVRFSLIRLADGRWVVEAGPEAVKGLGGGARQGSDDASAGSPESGVAAGLAAESGCITASSAGKEAAFHRGKYMVFNYQYTSSQDRKLWIDDVIVRGKFSRDTLAPRVTGVMSSGLHTVKVQYDEEVLPHSIYSYSRHGAMPDSMEYGEDNAILHYAKPFPNLQETGLLIRGISDSDGNRMRDTIVIIHPQLPLFGDLVINEVMADPQPRVYLPDMEYVELYNRTSESVSLEHWTLAVNARSYEFPECTIAPGGYLICTQDPVIFGTSDSLAVSLFKSSVSLPNTGGEISLYDPYFRLIHRVEYGSPYPADPDKSEGGWSLENADPDYLCGEYPSWQYSISNLGGTPAKPNSAVLDISDDSGPLVAFTGIITGEISQNASYKGMEPGDGEWNAVGQRASENRAVMLHFHEPVLVTEHQEAMISAGDYRWIPQGSVPFSDRALVLPLPSGSGESLWEVQVDEVADCTGNRSQGLIVPVGLPVPPPDGKLLLSEVLYHPAGDGSEYFELFNAGNSWLDLYDIHFSVGQPGELAVGRKEITEESHLLAPGGYVVLCRNREALLDEWGLSAVAPVVAAEGWTQLPDQGACIQLVDRAGQKLDGFCYHDSLHQDLLADYTGIALERVSFHTELPAGQGWTSASFASGYGTPGRENSQWLNREEQESAQEVLRLYPQVFSPDGDGYEDLLEIDLVIPDPFGLYDMLILDRSGNFIRQLVAGGNTGRGDRLYWDGKDRAGHLVPPGLYIVHCRLYGASGSLVKRKAVAIIYR